jgi:hypothetical protein
MTIGVTETDSPGTEQVQAYDITEAVGETVTRTFTVSGYSYDTPYTFGLYLTTSSSDKNTKPYIRQFLISPPSITVPQDLSIITVPQDSFSFPPDLTTTLPPPYLTTPPKYLEPGARERRVPVLDESSLTSSPPPYLTTPPSLTTPRLTTAALTTSSSLFDPNKTYTINFSTVSSIVYGGVNSGDYYQLVAVKLPFGASGTESEWKITRNMDGTYYIQTVDASGAYMTDMDSGILISNSFKTLKSTLSMTQATPWTITKVDDGTDTYKIMANGKYLRFLGYSLQITDFTDFIDLWKITETSTPPPYLTTPPSLTTPRLTTPPSLTTPRLTTPPSLKTTRLTTPPSLKTPRLTTRQPPPQNPFRNWRRLY